MGRQNERLCAVFTQPLSASPVSVSFVSSHRTTKLAAQARVNDHDNVLSKDFSLHIDVPTHRCLNPSIYRCREPSVPFLLSQNPSGRLAGLQTNIQGERKGCEVKNPTSFTLRAGEVMVHMWGIIDTRILRRNSSSLASANVVTKSVDYTFILIVVGTFSVTSNVFVDCSNFLAFTLLRRFA